ncbi:MAG: hypothetical protein VB078_09065 [Clostridiaceae bacterium]|nr:hypothetical protein [Clostridiaceae bacterium]
MQERIDQARKNTAALLAIYYQNAKLLADHLEGEGQYRSFWEVNDTVIEAICSDIFDGNSAIFVYELAYKECQFPRITIAC